MSTVLEPPPGFLSSLAEPLSPTRQELVYAGMLRRAAAQAIDFCTGAMLSSAIAVHDDLGIPEFGSRLIAGVLHDMVVGTVVTRCSSKYSAEGN